MVESANIGPVVPSQLQLTSDVTTTKPKHIGKDSISKIQGAQEHWVAIRPSMLDRPELPAVRSQRPDALLMFAKAFASVIASMTSSSMTSLEQLGQSQQLNQIQSQIILAATTNSIDKQEKAYKDYEHMMAKANNPFVKILGIVFMVIMIVVIIATIASGFLSGGATDAAVAPEITATTAGSSAITAESGSEAMVMETSLDEAMGLGNTTETMTTESAVSQPLVAETSFPSDLTPLENTLEIEPLQMAPEEGSEIASTTSESTIDEGSIAESRFPSTLSEEEISETTSITGSLGSTVSETSEGIEMESLSTDAETQASQNVVKEGAGEEVAKKGLSTAARRWIVLLASMIGASPQLTQGIMSSQLCASLNQLATAQKDIGQGSAKLSFQQAMFQFLQQAGGRTGQLAASQGKGAADAIAAISEVISTYSQIAKGSQPTI